MTELSRRHQRHVTALERRRGFLLGRIENYSGADPSRDRAEAAAISWALRIVRHAQEQDILHDLEAVTR